MSLLRQLGKDILVYGSGDLVLKLAAFITLPLYTRLFTTADYGTLSTIVAISSVAASITGLGLSSAMQRSYFAKSDEDYRARQVSTGFWGLAGWSLVILVAALAVAPPLVGPIFGGGVPFLYIALALAAVPLVQLTAYCQDTLRAQFRPWLFTLVGLVSQLAQIGLAVCFILWLTTPLEGYFLGTLFAGFLALALAATSLRGSLRARFVWADFAGFARFGAPLVISGLAGPLVMLANRVILARFAGVEEVAYLAVATTIASSMGLMGAAFARAWSPVAWRMRYETPDYRASFARILVYLLTGFAVVAVGIAAFAPELVAILTPAAYRAASWVVAPLVLYMVANASVQVTALGISIEGRTRWFAILYWIALLLNVTLDLLLVQRWGAVGIAVATLIAEIFVTVALAAVSQRLHPLPYPLVKLGALTLATTLFTLATYFLPLAATPAFFAAKLVFVLAFCLILVLLRIIGIGELQALCDLLRAPKQAELKS
jgi:O-antigen/teichoic acid export membrane protein